MSNNLNRQIVINGKITASGPTMLKKHGMIGKDFVVLPSTMMVEGAYCPYIENIDDRESLFFSGDELAKSVGSWNGRPVSMNHPEDQETCNCPDNYQKQWLGFIFNTRYEEVSRELKAELWIDAVRGDSIIGKIKNGDQIDVSIGAYGDLTPVLGGDNGTEHQYKMTNIVGDHLAVLPDGVGACSWKDGCGIRASAYVKEDSMPCREEQRALVCSILNTARTPSYDGTETVSWEGVSKTLESYLKGYYKHSEVKAPDSIPSRISDLSSSAKRWIASKSLLGDPDVTEVKDLVFFPVVNPGSNKLNEGALRSVVSGRGYQADIPEKTRTSAQNKARSLLKSEFKIKSEAGEKKMKEDKVVEVVEKEKSHSEEVEVRAAGRGNEFNMDNWLESVPSQVKNYLVSSMKNYDDSRIRHLNKILNCSKVNFCKDKLGEVMDMGLLENIASLVDLVESGDKTRSVAACGDSSSNYQLRGAFNNSVDTPEYAHFKDIDWTN